ncbi:MAG: hypothetical protein AB1649_09705 [Chloroflexota bacterium]
MKRLFTLICLLLVVSLACASPIANEASGTVLFQDDFSQPTSGWDRFQAEGGMMDYDGGGYRFLVNQLNTNFWATPDQEFTDVRLEVDSGKLGGPDQNRIGLLCRFTETDYYFFLISSDGFYTIGIYTSGQAMQLGQSEMQASQNINKGMAVNHLRADCIADTLTFYVNGVQVAQAKDSRLKSGDVGLLAGTFDAPGVDVIFDNFVALNP